MATAVGELMNDLDPNAWAHFVKTVTQYGLVHICTSFHNICNGLSPRVLFFVSFFFFFLLLFFFLPFFLLLSLIAPRETLVVTLAAARCRAGFLARMLIRLCSRFWRSGCSSCARGIS